MNWQDRITVDPTVLVGKPVIRGTRIAVEFVINLLSQGWPESEEAARFLDNVVKRPFNRLRLVSG